MNLQTSEKIKHLNNYVLQAFEDTVLEDILNNARKSGEALCKAIILHHYGESKGSRIILGHEKIDGAEPKRERELNFSELIAVAVHEQNEDYMIIKPKITRGKIKNYFETIRTHGNIGSHDLNSA